MEINNNAQRDPILGRQVRCKLTGFAGIATGRSTYLMGCDQRWADARRSATNPEQQEVAEWNGY